MKKQYRLPEGGITTDVEAYLDAWVALANVAREFFPGYDLHSYDPIIALTNNQPYAPLLRFTVSEVQALRDYRDRKQAEIAALKKELRMTREELKAFYKAKWRWEIPSGPYAVRMPQEAVIAKLEELLTKDPFDRAAIIEAAYWDESVTYDWDDDVAAMSHKVREHFEPGWQRMNEELEAKE